MFNEGKTSCLYIYIYIYIYIFPANRLAQIINHDFLSTLKSLQGLKRKSIYVVLLILCILFAMFISILHAK